MCIQFVLTHYENHKITIYLSTLSIYITNSVIHPETITLKFIRNLLAILCFLETMDVNNK